MPAANGDSVPALPELSSVGQPDKTRWSDLRKRVASAAILAPAVLICIWLGGAPYKVMLIVGTIGVAWEWAGMCGAPAIGLPGLVGAAATVVGALAAALDHATIGLMVIAGGTIVTAIAGGRVAYRHTLAAGVPYAGVGAIGLLWLRADPVAGLTNLLFLLLLVWASDIGAYATGRLLGGPRLAPRISPGKTWSGAGGGLAAAIVTGMLIAAVSDGFVQVWRAGVIAALLGIVAQAGDLLESLIKRHVGVKDSGTLIPGHGGLLDRVDALLIAAPIAALLALAAGRGVVLWR